MAVLELLDGSAEVLESNRHDTKIPKRL